MNSFFGSPRWTAIKNACRTLRFRLMVWNALIVLLSAGVTLACLRAGVRFALLHEVDALLTEDIREVLLVLKDAPVDHATLYEGLDQRAQGRRPHGWFVVFFDSGGKPLWSSDNTPPEALEYPPSVNDMSPSTLDSYRILDRRIALPNAGIETIRVGASLHPIWQDLARIDRQVAIAAGVVLLLAPLLGYWLAGRATEPLSDMIHSASRLRPSHLEERLARRGTRDELDQLADTINGLLNRIAAHLERKRDLLANAAHELRTPLAAIRSSIEVTLNEERTAEDYQELLSEIIEESSHLETLVNQLLLLSETEVDALPGDLQPVSLDRVVSRSVEMFRGVAESREIDLQLRLEPCVVPGNTDHLRQVINNLLDNAVKYTPDGGCIRVTVCGLPQHEQAELVVANTGPGIPSDEQKHVFDRFFRGSGVRFGAGEYQGTGLGLSICQAVVLAHRGGISVQSNPSEGTSFTVVLPAVAVPLLESGCGVSSR